MIVRKLAAGSFAFRGAPACAGQLDLDDFAADFAALGIAARIGTEPLEAMPVFRRALGERFARLPAVTRAVHRPAPAIVLEGRADIDGPGNPVTRLIARLFALPAEGRAVPVRVVIEADGAVERWSRVYPTRVMRSVMHAPDPGNGSVAEAFGPLTVRLRIDASADGLALVPLGGRFGPLPIPRVLMPRITAAEAVDDEGRHLFDVAIGLPVLGRLVHYRGWLALPSG